MNFKYRSALSAAFAVAVMFSGCADLASENDKKNNNIVLEYNQERVDSLFTELVDRIETTVDNEEDYQATIDLDFTSLATEFHKYASEGDMKANLGYIVAEMMSLNKSQSLKKIADSLDVYFSGFESTDEVVNGSTTSRAASSDSYQRGDRIRGIASQLFAKRKNTQQISRAYQENGINGMATSLLARTPEMILTRAEVPSWPSFITVSHVQDIIDNEVSSRLDKVIAACERMEEHSYGESLTITVLDETVELDVADIYLLDASVRALRSSLKLFTAYEWDVYAPNTSNYSWIDTMMNFEGESRLLYYTYSLSNDTLNVISNYSLDKELMEYTYDLLKYNLGRDSFCSIRRSNHETAYNDLKAIPQKLRKAIVALDNETDSKENDLIKKADLTNLDEDMVSIKQDLLDEGFSEAFASNFSSPKALTEFVDEILTGPYNFNESFVNDAGEKVTFDITVDISKFFTNPIQDFKDYLPLYKFRDKGNIYETVDYYQYAGYNSGSSFSINEGYGDAEINISSNMIVSDTTNKYGERIITLNEPFVRKHYYDRYPMMVPFDFTDNNGTVISWEDMETMVFDDGEIPYFKDYTVNGIFPGMTREKWNTLLQDLYSL